MKFLWFAYCWLSTIGRKQTLGQISVLTCLERLVSCVIKLVNLIVVFGATNELTLLLEIPINVMKQNVMSPSAHSSDYN